MTESTVCESRGEIERQKGSEHQQSDCVCVCVCVSVSKTICSVCLSSYKCKCVCAHACMCLFVPIVLTQVLPLTTEWSQQSPESNKGACLNTNQISRGT